MLTLAIAITIAITGASAAPDAGSFAALLHKAEAGADVDFVALRQAYLKSDGPKRALEVRPDIRQQRKKLWAAMQAHDDQGVLDAANNIILLSPIDLEARRARWQACKALKQDDCAKTGQAFELKMLQAITDHGDGKSCGTAFVVVSVDEERFLLRTAGQAQTAQALTKIDGHACDKIDTRGKGGSVGVTWFRVDDVLGTEGAR
ncbi:MAG TPA: DUF4919 domain-containing protein [Myxococcota bacterium]|jgi:hypothetical protein